MSVDHKPRVVFLSQYFHPEENTTSWLMSELAYSLADDFEIVAVAGQPTYRKGNGQESVPKRLDKNGVQILRVASTRLSKQSTVGRVINTLTFTFFTTLKLLTLPRVDLVFAVTNPPLLHWIATFVGMVRRIPVVLLIHDQYPEIVTALGKLPADSMVIRLWKRITGWSYRRAGLIVSLGRCMTARLRADYADCVGDRIVDIPNWDDGAKIRPVSREDNSLLDEWNLRDRFVVLYAGNIGLFHEIATVVDAAGLLRESNIQFVFVGDGGQSRWLADRIAEQSLDNIRILPFRPKEEMPLVLTACDAALITLKEEATGLCVPSKLYGTLASGKPILCVMNPSSETALAVSEAQCGAVVAPGEADTMAALLRDWSARPESVETMGANARRAFDEHYAQPMITERYREALLRLLLRKTTSEATR